METPELSQIATFLFYLRNCVLISMFAPKWCSWDFSYHLILWPGFEPASVRELQLWKDAPPTEQPRPRQRATFLIISKKLKTRGMTCLIVRLDGQLSLKLKTNFAQHSLPRIKKFSPIFFSFSCFEFFFLSSRNEILARHEQVLNNCSRATSILENLFFPSWVSLLLRLPGFNQLIRSFVQRMRTEKCLMRSLQSLRRYITCFIYSIFNNLFCAIYKAINKAFIFLLNSECTNSE